MTGADKLVLGASGFLGSHVTRQLVERGDTVRVMLRPSSSTCDVVFYCVVDTRAQLRDPAPLYRTNVEGLRHVLDAAVNADLRRFVFTSTIRTIGFGTGSPPRTGRWSRPRRGIPKPAIKAIGLIGGVVGALTRRDLPLNPTTVRLMHIMAPMDHGKAVRELGRRPRDVHESIREAAEWFEQG